MTSMNAQTFGVKAGLNIADINYAGDYASENNKRSKSKIGMQFGVFAEFEISEKLAFQPELVFSMQGQKVENSDSNYSSEGTGKYNYLNIPLMGKYYVNENISVQLGPQIGFLMSANTDTSTTINGITTENSSDVKKDIKSMDFGLNFGAGYKMDNGIAFDLRYNLSLTDIAKERSSNDNGKAKNAVINFTVNYAFDF